ncbi:MULTISPECIES: MDR family oxidoreductase [Burkholderia]|uniref:Oxidoreductase n=1 Tax=Burkholderia cenocepacia TaxID=95486 RepID=A0ABD4ULN3_9BURK|nr:MULTISPECIES: MDR family oxidoreductase [Burkholderia]MCW3698915.1 oxidoreductase [Burkholderia cenocepacia]MCW3706533.1 oxidoreductase [Burkholderia cenocepacia]MCW3714976.1 oxidoreductase [Burkholderia cenocepacia]MCW3722708.1 oxidoreductase [Burkholderia cenocepacia]MCW3729762.1 oxidoreductase [Burkholderia cenocepacia]
MSIEQFRALVLREEEKKTNAAVETLGLDALPNEDTLVQIDYSTLNFKDALAVTGRGKIVKAWPLVPGIDFAGTVVESSNPNFKSGTKVVLTGWSVGEKFWGGYSQLQRVKSDWLVPLPEGLTTRQAMMVGTAGFTGMLCVNAIERAGVSPKSGPVLVTGAAGGVGSVAVAILAKLGYTVTALTGDTAKHDYVATLGAAEFADGPQWAELPRPLEGQRWAAAIDTVGSKVLARVLAEMNYGGVVAACGLAGGADLPTTVMPFILRNVNLIGVDSVMLPTPERIMTWKRVVHDLPIQMLEGITATTVSLDEVKSAAERMLDGKLRGRVLVDVNAE